MLNKQELIDLIKVESEITKKVIMAFPEGQLEYTPHEKSTSAGKLIRVFSVDFSLAEAAAKGQSKEDPYEGVEEVVSVSQGAELFTQHADKFIDTITNSSQDQLDSKLEMWGMAKTRTEFLMMFLYDMIHHRGQMSVYIRMAGGLVPSIYGPSADDKGDM